MRPVASSPRSVYVVVAVAFALIVVLVTRGGSEPGLGRVAPSPSGPRPVGGFLVYAVEEGDLARLHTWDLLEETVEPGPLIPAPEAIVNVRSPGYGWLGLTSNLGDGVREASVLDSLDPQADPERLGSADVVTWARQGATVVLLERGPLLDGCRRDVVVAAVDVTSRNRETIVDETVCGDVLSAGRTSSGYFLTRQDGQGIDVIGAGYANAGVLLPDHGVIAISPGGDLLVTPSSEFLPAVLAPRPARAGYDPPPTSIRGAASHFTQFGGDPVPYEISGLALRIDGVIAYAPGATRALVVGRVGDDPPALWEVPLVISEDGSIAPRRVGAADGTVAAAYANDGTAYVLSGGWMHRLRDHGLERVDMPEGAPVPTGPIAWIVRAPFVDL